MPALLTETVRKAPRLRDQIYRLTIVLSICINAFITNSSIRYRKQCRWMMTTFSLPAASLRSASRLPAARVWFWVSKYLVYIVLWAKGRAIFREESIFLPESREAAGAGGTQEFAPDTSLCHNRVTTAE